MTTLKIHKGDWIVVCDGKKALILENIGDEKFPNLHTREVREHADASTHDQGTDRPGRVHSSVGAARSAIEQTDWHRESERVFLHDLVAYLDTAVTSGKPVSLVIISPPRALGMLREAYSPSLRAAIKSELAHDYVNHAVYDIEKRLFA